MEVYQPDIILAIADSRTSLGEGYKRISKSVDRSYNLLDKCVERYKGSKQLQNSTLIGMYSFFREMVIIEKLIFLAYITAQYDLTHIMAFYFLFIFYF